MILPASTIAADPSPCRHLRHGSYKVRSIVLPEVPAGYVSAPTAFLALHPGAPAVVLRAEEERNAVQRRGGLGREEEAPEPLRARHRHGEDRTAPDAEPKAENERGARGVNVCPRRAELTVPAVALDDLLQGGGRRLHDLRVPRFPPLQLRHPCPVQVDLALQPEHIPPGLGAEAVLTVPRAGPAAAIGVDLLHNAIRVYVLHHGCLACGRVAVRRDRSQAPSCTYGAILAPGRRESSPAA
eukprot:CAMPEP_0118859616 /NCGR_PEP_ID=MMETSP1163-20130328/5789_1 /TAXON_ID=124430 /ORGANISM="Phaeomonas parva, Strain CCMP2877" /LENGTH=240 /DNA_ID=CAMNT_0006793231 /DNA_START=189 /DNA_END=911 /DNA_ORIENTATION=+